MDTETVNATIDTMMSEIRQKDKEAQIEAMRKYVYFTFNWTPDFVKRVWGNDNDLTRHFEGKLKAYDFNIDRFFVELSTSNQHRMLEWILDNYEC